MDPMDYTMDQTTNTVMTASSPNAQCQPQSQPPSNRSSFAPYNQVHPARDTQSHYDPVHDSSTWHQSALLSNTSHRPTYPPPLPQFSAWHAAAAASPLNAFTRQSPNWAQIDEMNRMNLLQQEYVGGEYGRSFVPWDQSRAFEGGNSGHHSSSAVNTSGNSVSDPAVQQARSAGMVAPPQSYLTENQQVLRDTWPGTLPPPPAMLPTNTTSSTSRPVTDPASVFPAPDASYLEAQQTIASGLAAFSRAARASIPRHDDVSPSTIVYPAGGRRRQTTGWDSDEDEESRNISRMEDERERRERYRRAAEEALFGGDLDEERSVAALRGVLATAKKIPSKAAIEALEVVRVSELSEADRSCIICYNEFGVSNPEGEIEKPIRLPKCKHIFGDRCIKKWFEDSDSCPYCRDKLPAEMLNIKKLAGNYGYRFASREQMRAAAFAQRMRAAQTGQPIPATSAADADNARNGNSNQRTRDEYDIMMARQSADTWNFMPSNRGTAGDSPERRRQARGRHIRENRGPHYLGARPTSVGSARVTPSFSNQLPRGYDFMYQNPRRGAASGPDSRDEVTGELQRNGDLIAEMTANMQRAQAAPATRSGLSRPTRAGRFAFLDPPSVYQGQTAPLEEPSPPIAVGSGAANRRPERNDLGLSRVGMGSGEPEHTHVTGTQSDSRHRSGVEGQVGHGGLNTADNSSATSVDVLHPASRNIDSSLSQDLSSTITPDRVRTARLDQQLSPGWDGIN